MKERSFFKNETPNETPVVIDEKKRGEFMKKMKDAINACGFLMNLIGNDQLTEDRRETMITNIDMNITEALKIVGYETTSAKREDDLIRRLRNANIDNRELRQQLSEKVSFEDVREKIKVIARAFDEWGDYHGFGYISDIHFDDYGYLHGNMNLSTHISGNRAEDLRKMGFELTDDRDGEAMFATDENFKLLQKMIRENFGPDASMSYGKIDMHSFSDERPHMREVEIILRDLDVMKPWVEEYTEHVKQENKKARNMED